MPGDPYADALSIEAEAKAANGEVLRLIRLFGDEADAQGGCWRSGRFWEMALGPFLLPAVHMLADRQRRVADLIKRYGDERLRVELLPEDVPFSFHSTLDFTVNGIQDVRFNHYVFSRILQSVLASSPAGTIPWCVAYSSPEPLHQANGPGRRAFSARIADVLRWRLRDLPFPRYKGFSLAQALFLSLAVLLNKRRLDDRRLDFSLYCTEGFRWIFPAEKLIRACLPTGLRDGLSAGKSVPHAAEGRPNTAPGTFRGMTPAYMQDDAYRLRLAELLESGFRLFGLQHGANYGNLRSVGILPFEYSQHAFFTWGWRNHEGVPSNARPLPHPALTSICGRHKETAPRLILVGAEMSTYLYRLKSRPQAGAMLAYRKRKTAFFRCLAEALGLPTPAGTVSCGRLAAPELLYRPYFKVAGGLDDADYVLRRVPEVGLCTGDLTERMLGCRLLVLDHYGTTLHMALAADVPTLTFWNRDEWGMERESERVLDILQECGILHASPEDAAHHAARFWNDPSTWWKSPPVRKARSLWLRRYATAHPWTRLRLTGEWFKALLES